MSNGDLSICRPGFGREGILTLSPVAIERTTALPAPRTVPGTQTVEGTAWPGTGPGVRRAAAPCPHLAAAAPASPSGFSF